MISQTLWPCRLFANSYPGKQVWAMAMRKDCVIVRRANVVGLNIVQAAVKEETLEVRCREWLARVIK